MLGKLRINLFFGFQPVLRRIALKATLLCPYIGCLGNQCMTLLRGNLHQLGRLGSPRCRWAFHCFWLGRRFPGLRLCL